MGLSENSGTGSPVPPLEQEAYLNLRRTTAMLTPALEALLRRHGLSEATYNVLRILRDAGGHPPRRTCAEIREHLLTQVPDVTRLVDRLVRARLVTRHRCPCDRRRVHVTLTERGEQVLADLDRPILDLHRTQLGHMTREELSELSRLLIKARNPNKIP